MDALKTQRLAAGLSISGLAQAANVSDQTITQLEDQGHTSLNVGGAAVTGDIADRICDGLGISRATAGFVDMG